MSNRQTNSTGAAANPLPALLVALSILLLLGGCRGATDEQEAQDADTSTTTLEAATDGASSDTTSADGSEAPVDAGPTVDAIAWEDCGPLQCGSIDVPLDYNKPGDASLNLSLVMVPATGRAKGSIFVNPGGPGASGIEFVQSGFRFDDQTSSTYNLIGFDPRGIGQSSPLTCRADRAGSLLPDFSPDNAAERAALDDNAVAIAQDCAQSDQAVLPHLTTSNVARDLDLMRQAVGDEQLHYYGLSYGTFLATHYADLFPQTVGHLVLDGVVDPTLDLPDLLVQQSEAFDAAFDRLDDACSSGTLNCPADGTKAAYDRLADELEREGSVGDVGPSELAMASLLALYTTDLWQPYASALEVADGGNFASLESLSDLFIGSVSYTAYAAYACVDSQRPDDAASWDRFVDDAVEASPRFGSTVANELRVCAHWPVDPDETSSPNNVVDAQSLADVEAIPLIIGTTGDAATPVENAHVVGMLFGDASVAILDSNRHTAYNGSSCIRDLVADYFADESLAGRSLEC